MKFRVFVTGLILLHVYMPITLVSSVSITGGRKLEQSVAVQMRKEYNDHIVVDNGYVKVTLAVPDGLITGVEYNGIENVLAGQLDEDLRGYSDVVWNEPGNPYNTVRIPCQQYDVVKQDDDQVELSFTYTYDPSSSAQADLPLNFEKRIVFLRGVSGFYTYEIYERLEGWPDLNIIQLRDVFRLNEDLFSYMAVSDDRQRQMPTAEDRALGQPLDYPEAVLLTNPRNPDLTGEVDDKYQYSCENKDNRVHGWISFEEKVGFWMITPSNEFRTAGPVKQDLTSHAGPITLSMYVSNHYAGKDIDTQFHGGEPWKKVFGPVFVYLNCLQDDEDDPVSLWEDAKQQLAEELELWPYDFPASDDFLKSNQRGSVTGTLRVYDPYEAKHVMKPENCYVGLAAPGEAGSWQVETKGYQYWVQTTTTTSLGDFQISNVRPGVYNLYAWAAGFIGDYKYEYNITILPELEIRLGKICFEPPRNGPTLWEIGYPDRTASEFYVPDPNPTLVNRLFDSNSQNKFRQYGLWARYADIYTEYDLVYTVGLSVYQTDWFFAHVTRQIGPKQYQATTRQIIFQFQNPSPISSYTLRIALASATFSDLEIRFNDPEADVPDFKTGQIGKDNAIARHGIHGLYWLFSFEVSGSLLQEGENIIYLTQTNCTTQFNGVMYDYIRFEGPNA
ncbi:hypothetical protein QQ045_012249 [Rhodiola kirilowii]